jgi:predicted adenylyl cyclase CyaB
MQNIEVKVHVPDLATMRERASALGAEFRWTASQTDTYFHVPRGRLKLRESDVAEPATLISYARPDDESSRISHYRLLPVSEVETLKLMLAETLGVLVVVRKVRELYLFGNTRIHLDDVDDLGTFVELETVIGDQTNERAWLEHRHAVRALQLNEHEPVSVSYSDLMLKNKDNR